MYQTKQIRLKLTIFLFIAQCMLTTSVWGQIVTRGPYLQMGTTTSVIIKWRTDNNSNSKVNYGTSQGSLTSSVTDGSFDNDHSLTISGLTPNTVYYYDIGTTTHVLESGSNLYFQTHPTIGSTGPVTIWAIGDSGLAGSDQRNVRDGFKSANGNSSHCDVWLMLGDNAYNFGSNFNYENALFDVYQDTLENSILWPCRGNHDADSSVYYNRFSLPTAGQSGGTPSGSEAYYSFDYANIHFISLDSSYSSRSPTGSMHTWLEDDLDDTT